MQHNTFFAFRFAGEPVGSRGACLTRITGGVATRFRVADPTCELAMQSLQNFLGVAVRLNFEVMVGVQRHPLIMCSAFSVSDDSGSTVFSVWVRNFVPQLIAFLA
jgi:hypothetical protein